MVKIHATVFVSLFWIFAFLIPVPIVPLQNFLSQQHVAKRLNQTEAECAVILKNFYPSILLFIRPSLLEICATCRGDKILLQ